MTLAFKDKDYAAYSLNVLLGLDVTTEMKDEMVIHAENWLKK